jgi:hypothetical protein
MSNILKGGKATLFPRRIFYLVKEVVIPPKPIVVGGRVLARRDGDRHSVDDNPPLYLGNRDTS